MELKPVSKDANKTCKCGDYIFVLGMDAWRLRKRDSLGRPIYICDKCKGK